MNQEQEKAIEKAMNDQYLRGLAVGCKSVTGVIYNKVKNVNRNSTKNDLIRVIKDIVKFCETGLAIKEESNQESGKEIMETER